MSVGLDYVGGDIVGPGQFSNNSGNKTNNKYFTIETGKNYYFRIVSGWVPFYSIYPANAGSGASKISPATLLIEQKKQNPNGTITLQRVWTKPDGSYYSDQEAFCPLIAAGAQKQTRYAINVFDVMERKNNPEKINVYILSGGWSIFEPIIHFRNDLIDYSPNDPVRGPIWRLQKTQEGKTTKYLCQAIQQTYPLSPLEIEYLSKGVKTLPTDDGLWDLRKEYHPFTCSIKQAVNNGYNPLFAAQGSATESNVPLGVAVNIQSPQPVQQVQQLNPVIQDPQFIQQAPQASVVQQPVMAQVAPQVTISPQFAQSTAPVNIQSVLSSQVPQQIAPVNAPVDRSALLADLQNLDNY